MVPSLLPSIYALKSLNAYPSKNYLFNIRDINTTKFLENDVYNCYSYDICIVLQIKKN